jgi:hypothetical protein
LAGDRDACARWRGAARGDFYRVKLFSGEVTHEAIIGKVVL